MAYYTIIVLSLVTLIIYAIILFLLIGARKRLKDGMQFPIGYVVAAICVLIIIRSKDVLEKSEIFTISIPYVHESLVLLFSLLLLIGIASLHRRITNFTNHKKKK